MSTDGLLVIASLIALENLVVAGSDAAEDRSRRAFDPRRISQTYVKLLT
jgi:hypothetical protein